jgi:hypothetical protein
LVGKPSCKIADPSSTITGDIRYLSDVVEHVAAGEKEDSDQTYCSPNIAVLDDG